MTRTIVSGKKDRKPPRWSVIFLAQAAAAGAIALGVSDKFNGASLLAVALVVCAITAVFHEQKQPEK